METGKTGVTGHDAELVHYVPDKWEKKWILFKRWVKRERTTFGFIAILVIVGTLLELFLA